MAFSRHLLNLFTKGNVCVSGMMGSGKDVLFGNVIQRLKRPYISNLDYGGDRIVFKPWMLDFNNNWRHLMEGNIQHYEHIFPDRVYFYLSDWGIYCPAQEHGVISRDYPYLATSMAMVRQVAGSWFHANCQVPNRMYDKCREQFDVYLDCKWCHFIFGKLVIQRVIEYERYQSCVDRVPVFPLRRPLLNRNRIQMYEIQRANYLISHGRVIPHLLIYWNRSKHNTRGFKEMFASAKTSKEVK